MRDFGESPYGLAVMLPNSSSEGARWMVALLVSIGVNVLAFLIFASVMGLEWTKHAPAQSSPVVAPPKVVAVIRPEMIRPKVTVPPDPKSVDRSASLTPPPPLPPAQGFLRTSPAQEAEAPAQAQFIGERNTRATSDAPPVKDGPLIPSQTGRDPRRPEEIETTESRYQDGKMVPDPITQPPPAPEVSAKATPPAQPQTTELADPSLANRPEQSQPVRNEPAPPLPPPQGAASEEKGAEIVRATENKRVREMVKKVEPEIVKSDAMPPMETNPIRQEELPKPLAEKSADNKKSLPDAPVAENKESAKPQAKPSKPVPIKDPAFRGYQQKTKLSGSIARRGTSAMDVADSPLGRYHAQLSRAIEKEWQLNCKRYRDNIVPGSLTVSFLIDSAKGTVKSITFLDVFKGGEIQKGFTIKSIREAELPAIPKTVSDELAGEPLEVTYSFHF